MSQSRDIGTEAGIFSQEIYAQDYGNFLLISTKNRIYSIDKSFIYRIDLYNRTLIYKISKYISLILYILIFITIVLGFIDLDDWFIISIILAPFSFASSILWWYYRNKYFIIIKMYIYSSRKSKIKEYNKETIKISSKKKNITKLYFNIINYLSK